MSSRIVSNFVGRVVGNFDNLETGALVSTFGEVAVDGQNPFA